MTQLATEDRLAIQETLSRYCHCSTAAVGRSSVALHGGLPSRPQSGAGLIRGARRAAAVRPDHHLGESLHAPSVTNTVIDGDGRTHMPKHT